MLLFFFQEYVGSCYLFATDYRLIAWTIFIHLFNYWCASNNIEWASQVAQLIRSLGWKDPLEEEMATHPSVLPWQIPWTEEPGGLYSP